MKTTPSGLHLVRALVLVAMMLPASLFAQVASDFIEWTGGGTNWNDPSNWNKTYKYGQLEWKGGGNTTSWNNLGSPESQWRFYFSGSQAYTLGGNAVSFFDFNNANGGILNDSSVTQTINNNLNFADTTVGEAFILNRSTVGGALTFGGTITLTGNISYLGIGGTNGSGNITFNGPIVGNKGIVIGTNSLDLNGANMTGTRVVFNASNSYTGTTTILRGNLAITNGDSLSSNSVILGLGAVGFIADAGLTVNSTTTASNNFRFTDAGTNVTLTVTNGAAFTITGALANDTGSSVTTKFSKAGAGTLILANASSTYAGQIQIGNGTVVIGQSSSLGVNVSTNNRGIDLGLSLRDVSEANNVSLLLSNGVTLSNSIYVAPNTSGATRTLGIAGTGSAIISNQVYLDGNLTLEIGTGNSLTMLNVPSGNAFSGGTGGLIKSGAGTLNLNGTSTYTGKTILAGGRVNMSGASDARFGAAPASFTADSLTLSNGVFLFTTNGAGNSVWNPTRGITIGSGGATWQIGGSTEIALNGTNLLNGSGDLLKFGSGTLTLANSNSFSGAMRSTNEFAGTLNLNHQFALANSTLIRTTLTGSGNSVLNFGSVGGTNFTLGALAASTAGVGSDIGLTNSAGAGITLTVGGNNSNTTYAAVLSGAGGLTKVGSGTMSLTGLNTFTGALTVLDGRISIFRTTSNSITASSVVINGGNVFQVSGGGNASHLITNTATMTISSGSYNLQFLNQNLAALDMSGGAINATDFATLQYGSASSVTGGTVNLAGPSSWLRFNNDLALGGANMVYSNASNGAGGNVRIVGTTTYSATNTAAANFSNAAAGVGHLELSSASSTNTFNIADSGSVASEVNINWTVAGNALRKTGGGVLTLGGTTANTYSGNTVVEGGTLALNKTAGTTAIAGNVEVGSGAKLLISASEQVADGSAVTLSGGTISKGSGAISETFGALSLTSTSFVDFGSGTGNFSFATYSPSTFQLTFQNFNLGNSLTVRTGTFTASEFNFNGFGYSLSAVPSGGFTITAIPEPSTVLAALGLSGLMLWSPLRRRFARRG